MVAFYEQFRAARRALTLADRALLSEAGLVGIEIVREIRTTWPEKTIVPLDSQGDMLRGPYMPELRAELLRQPAENL